MVKHIVFWQLKEEEAPRAAAIAGDLRALFQALLGVVEGLEAIELGENYNNGPYQLALYCAFSSRQAEQAYQTHPAHLAIKQIVHTLVCGRAAVDYEV